MSTRIIGLVIGGGDLPRKVIETLLKSRQDFKLVVLKDFAKKIPEISEIPHISIKLGQAGKAIAFFKERKVTDILMVGNVKRPSLTSLVPDMWSAKFIAKIGLKSLGDDGMLKAITNELKKEGFNIIGIQDIMGNIIAKSGVYGKYTPDEIAFSDIKHGIKILKDLSHLDIGQGVIVQQGLILAVEAIEGTDNMLIRTKDLIRDGSKPVLIKMKKVSQHDKVDLPTIGSNTVILAKENGIRGIAIHAGNALVADYDEMIKTADNLGIFIYGYKDE